GEVVGVAFRLRDADGNPGPDMCSVAIKGGPDRDPEGVDIDPVASETGEIVFAPRNPTNGKRYGVSNVTVSVCAGDGAGGGGGDSGGEEEHGDDRTGDGNGGGTGNGGGNGNGGGTGNGGGNGRKGNGTPGKPDSKSANAGVGRGEGGEDGDTEAN
ncbi:hypothetical protein DJ72_01100, partial [Halorubrum distributum]